MTDEQVTKGYAGVTSSGVDAKGSLAFNLKADHLAVRAKLTSLEKETEELKKRVSALIADLASEIAV